MNGASALTFLREFLATLKIWVAKSTKHAERPIDRFFVVNIGGLTKAALRKTGGLAANPPLRDLINWDSWIGVSPEFPVFYA